MFTVPETDGSFVSSYLAPTYSAAKGRSNLLRGRRALISGHHYATNSREPLQKGNQLQKGASYQLIAVVPVDVCYLHDVEGGVHMARTVR